MADLLERVLDKGVVITGDIRINLVDVELLTIRIRLLVCSVDKAKELGIDWWNADTFFLGPDRGQSALPGRASAVDVAAGSAVHADAAHR
ncbi:gas vesicle protein [Burkholderia humptydooensis]|uniref:Gas vesicle protein n=2 Tax=Burkholderia humptydooensis TaxID=430531 RepID=A0A7U4PCK4_9BURK|nr:gas vesicle family protein [Burkholderia sp. 2002721687]ALX46934.1 gas vesicle protein GvpA [Burkholderia humptydooensis]EIP85686.1 gas vesicle synthesis protein [Burkholderia humptydooensis MSMB43]QPS48042.1 gas vesicle protein [Burkholderia humptydooensis]